jgi:integrase
MQTKTLRLTIKTINALRIPNRDTIHWDSELNGFGLKVTPHGRKTFLVQYRAKDRKQRKPSLGVFPTVKPEAARDAAREILARVSRGEDPMADRAAVRTALTMSDLFMLYLDRHARPKKKPGPVGEDVRKIEKTLRPRFGTKKVRAISREDIAALHHDLAGTPYEANRTVALLSKMFSLAEKWGLRPDGSNPCRHIEKNKEHPRKRYLSPEEYQRLFAVLDEVEMQRTEVVDSIAAIRLLALTGRRLGEVLNLRWDQLDLARGTMHLEDTKTGAKDFVLGEQVLTMLCQLRSDRAQDDVHVIRGRVKGQPLVNLQKPWQRIRKLAGIDDVHLHDLRHSYAATAVTAGQDLRIIGAQLGHTQMQTTMRYAHVAQDPLRKATDQVSNAIAGYMNARNGEGSPQSISTYLAPCPSQAYPSGTSSPEGHPRCRNAHPP